MRNEQPCEELCLTVADAIERVLKQAESLSNHGSC